MTPAAWLKRLYQHHGEFHILVNPGAIICLEASTWQKRFTGSPGRETVLRLFLNARDADAYRDAVGAFDAHISKTTLVGLWSLLPRIEGLSRRMYGKSVRVEVSTIDQDGVPRAVDVLHSTYELLS
jgi:hypothetical protein